MWFNNVIGAELRIKNADGFIAFKNDVNNGMSYSGTTVLLDSDIDLSGKTFEPIGYYSSSGSSKYFNGFFDGQGHAISNLIMASSSSQCVGLFGYSRGGSTIRNVILDSSCSFTSSYSADNAFVGGIIADCDTYDGPVTIENSVNMGSATFQGTTSSSYWLIMGGIVASPHFYKNDITIKNCANYGDLTHSGTVQQSYFGGIAGSFSSSSSSNTRAYIYNCLNYGKITHKGTSSIHLFLGGIAGYTLYSVTIENCVSGGNIISTPIKAPSNDNHIGSIVGEIRSGASVKYCYFPSGLGYNKYGSGTPKSESNIFSYDSTTFQLSGTVSIGSYTGNSLISGLNGYAAYKGSDYSHWLLNKNNKDVSFTINGRTNPIRMSYQIILMPSLAGEGKMNFDGWYMDRGLTSPLTLLEVNESIPLYGALFSSLNVVTFDVNGGNALSDSESKKEVTYNEKYEDLPTAKRIGYTFAGWFTEAEGGEEIKSGDVVKITAAQTLYAHWNPNTYTNTFNTTTADGGVLQYPSQSGAYDSEYGILPEPERTGYTFAGWFTEEDGQGERITEDTNVTIAANHTLYGHWAINNYTITFEYGNGADAEERVLDFNEPINYTEDLVREGYTFAGWDMKPDTVPAEDLTIKAQWTPNNYTLSFDGCGGEGVGIDKKNVTYDDTYGSLPEPTKTGYTFAGWFTEEGGQSDKIETGGQVKVTGDVTLYAHWTINKYTITFIFNNGAENEVRTLEFNEIIDYPDNLKKEGFVFEK